MRPNLLAALWIVGLFAAQSTSADDGWRYIVPAPGDPFANPPLRTIALTDDKPADLKVEVDQSGNRRRFGSLMYGTGRTVRAVIMLDESPDGKLALYVDADRSGTITPKKRVEGKDGVWRSDVPAVLSGGESAVEIARTVMFRYGRVSKTLAVATCGYVEGNVTIGGRSIRVRRVDGDCNGLLADPQDRVWIDLNGDGQWDTASEQHLSCRF